MKLFEAPVTRQPLTISIYRSKNTLKSFLIEHYPLLAILISYMLVALSAGLYQNGDTAWEYEAVSGVLKYGLPYAYGLHLIDQPPLGFYIQAFFFTMFGASIENGTFLVTLFGLGSVVLVYFIGKFAYNRSTGFFGALLFAFSPWHILISRSFLIDVPCLFLSLSAIFVGLIAIKKNSLGIFLGSGVLFAVAFNTKLYAVFALIPIITVLLIYGSRKFKSLLVWLFAFSVPVIIASYLWYETFAGIGIVSIFRHADFLTQNPSLSAPTYFFATNFLVSYGLGWLFIDAVALSLLFGVVFRKLFPRFFTFDVIGLFVIVSVIGVNTFLGAALDLKSPFLNAFKYDYQALPFFCLIAASLISKSLKILELTKEKTRLVKGGLVALGFIGLFLLVSTIYYNINRTLLFSKWDYFIFRVEPSVDSGYSLFNSTPVTANSSFVTVQMIGLTFALSGVIWISRHRLAAIFGSHGKTEITTL